MRFSMRQTVDVGGFDACLPQCGRPAAFPARGAASAHDDRADAVAAADADDEFVQRRIVHRRFGSSAMRSVRAICSRSSVSELRDCIFDGFIHDVRPSLGTFGVGQQAAGFQNGNLARRVGAVQLDFVAALWSVSVMLPASTAAQRCPARTSSSPWASLS